MGTEAQSGRTSWLAEARRRGVLRVAASYAVIAWLLLQIADVTFEPFGIDRLWLRVLVVAAATGLPVAIALAWFLEIGPTGIERDAAPAVLARPRVLGVRRFADLIVIGVLLLVVAFLLLRDDSAETRPPIAESSIAVLPFANVGAAENAYFSDGLSDELRDHLGRVSDLRVAARTSSLAAQKLALDARGTADKLAVAAFVEGTVRREGNRVRISVQLVSGKDGYRLWNQTFDREVEQVLVIQQEIAEAVAAQMLPKFTAMGGRLSAPATLNASALDLVLRGRRAERSETDAGLREAIALYEQATRLDPDYALAFAELGKALMYESTANAPRANSYIDRALSIDPNLAEGYLARGILLRFTNQPGVAKAYRRALELNDNNVEILNVNAAALNRAGERQRALALAERMRDIDPLNPGHYEYVAELLSALGRIMEGRQTLQLMAQKLPPEPQVQMIHAYQALNLRNYDEGIAYALKLGDYVDRRRSTESVLMDLYLTIGDVAAARAAAERGRDRGPPGLAAYVLWVSGDFRVLPAALDERLMSADGSPARYILASAQNALGDHAAAAETSRKAGLPENAVDEDRRENFAICEGLPEYMVALAALGETAEAQRLAHWTLDYVQLQVSAGNEAFPTVDWDAWVTAAQAHAILGDRGAALADLERLLALEGYIPRRDLAHRTALRPLIGDARFEAVREQLRARQREVRQRLPHTLQRFGIARPGA